ncbi:Uncharacterized protein APZ42_027502 [Daphnia magna]|uniref:Uncharacterized protein n=1 Tax=Daphnia magna TaxID=35525 RepID=A0A164RN41_9CRUS|nr:Uncharacterized protein APZ42_027502 [Daphnia magna]
MERVLSRRRLEKCETFGYILCIKKGSDVMTVAQLFDFQTTVPFEKVKEREMTRSHCSCKHDGEFIRFGGFGLILHLEQRQLNTAIMFDGLKQRYGS